MNRNRFLVALTLGLFFVSGVFSQAASEKYVPNEVLIKFEKGAADARRSSEKMVNEARDRKKILREE